jgi:predicted DNA-binding transcriptional regulator
MALSESVAHLNCLLQRGLVSREISDGGAWIWRTN